MNSKTYFDEPQVMVVRFEMEDVISTSGDESTISQVEEAL